MKTIRLTALTGIGAAILAASASMAPVFAHAGGSTAIYTVPQQRITLSPIVVDGQRLSLPVFLQLLRTALHRPWSSSRADENKLVCHFQTRLGTHMQTLRCMTNAQYFHQQDETQEALLAASHDGYTRPIYYALMNGQIPVSIANFTRQHSVNRGELMRLFKRLPPRGSSYTLRITSHGKALLDYVIKNGKLKAVRHYVYKNGKLKTVRRYEYGHKGTD